MAASIEEIPHQYADVFKSRPEIERAAIIGKIAMGARLRAQGFMAAGVEALQ
jgi:hypothetical protein